MNLDRTVLIISPEPSVSNLSQLHFPLEFNIIKIKIIIFIGFQLEWGWKKWYSAKINALWVVTKYWISNIKYTVMTQVLNVHVKYPYANYWLNLISVCIRTCFLLLSGKDVGWTSASAFRNKKDSWNSAGWSIFPGELKR